MKRLNCTLCGKPITLVPSAEERAAKDITGKTALYYRNLFTQHSNCVIEARNASAVALMKKLTAEALESAEMPVFITHQRMEDEKPTIINVNKGKK